MKLSRDKLRAIIKSVLEEQFTFPKGMKYSDFPRYTGGGGLDALAVDCGIED